MGCEPIKGCTAGYVNEKFRDGSAVLVADETGFLKRGRGYSINTVEPPEGSKTARLARS